MHKMGSASDLGNERASETWWNKQGVYGRQASTYWSIALAAAVMGLVILGHRWQYERRQNHQLRLRLCAKEEVIAYLLLCFILETFLICAWSVTSWNSFSTRYSELMYRLRSDISGHAMYQSTIAGSCTPNE